MPGTILFTLMAHVALIITSCIAIQGNMDENESHHSLRDDNLTLLQVSEDENPDKKSNLLTPQNENNEMHLLDASTAYFDRLRKYNPRIESSDRSPTSGRSYLKHSIGDGRIGQILGGFEYSPVRGIPRIHHSPRVASQYNLAHLRNNKGMAYKIWNLQEKSRYRDWHFKSPHQRPLKNFQPLQIPRNGITTTFPLDVDIPREVMQLLPSTVRKVYSNYVATSKPPPQPTTQPPVIWFPDLDTECEESSYSGASSRGGFSAFSFLAMVVSITNLVSLLASNANNNINNNNNNDNINNDNILDGNEANNNNNLDVFTMVTFAGRKRRHLNHLEDVFTSLRDDQSDFIPTAEDVVAKVGLHFLRTWYLATQILPSGTMNGIPDIQIGGFNEEAYSSFLNNSKGGTQRLKQDSLLHLTSYSILDVMKTNQEPSKSCVKRSLCEANFHSSALGKLGADVSEVLTAAFVEFLPKWETSRGSLSRAGERGRSGWECSVTYQCSDSEWEYLNTILKPEPSQTF
ncbi:hypothetical protein SK128_020751 [Halocaridina rubra]|uniref:Uncharacterized protein n=1 Tax=Halocaridina rubra TaxID=373956 RepID=A0AAN8X0X2_HALRR